MKNKLIVEGNVAKVVLNKGTALVDTDDLSMMEELGRTWKISTKGYAFTNERKEEGYTSLMLHRFILNPTRDLPLIDHITGETLDNRKVNLRRVTAEENRFNASNRFVNINDSRIRFLHVYADVHGIDLEKELRIRDLLHGREFFIRDARYVLKLLA